MEQRMVSIELLNGLASDNGSSVRWLAFNCRFKTPKGDEFNLG